MRGKFMIFGGAVAAAVVGTSALDAWTKQVSHVDGSRWNAVEVPLTGAAAAYRKVDQHNDGRNKVVLKPELANA